MPAHPPITIAGVVYEFPHLEPFTFNVTTEKVPRELVVHARFANHCYSETYEHQRHLGETVFMDAGNRPRVFCPVRYELSKSLPEVLRGLAVPQVKVTQTAERRNWVYSMEIESPSGPYHVFFSLRRATVAGQDLSVFVESAYHEDPALGAPNILGRMKFVTLCGKVFRGEPVSTRR